VCLNGIGSTACLAEQNGNHRIGPRRALND
jgi:hypothetical protein